MQAEREEERLLAHPVRVVSNELHLVHRPVRVGHVTQGQVSQLRLAVGVPADMTLHETMKQDIT